MPDPRPGEPRPGEHGGQIPQARYRDSEAQLGGADAVEKTTYVTGSGTSPEALKPPGQPAANTPSSGRSPMLWIVVAVVALVVIVFAAASFR